MFDLMSSLQNCPQQAASHGLLAPEVRVASPAALP
jgi:hypothetical protein